MGNPFEFTDAQSAWNCLRADYEVQPCDVEERPLDRAFVSEVTGVAPFAETHAGDRLSLPVDQTNWNGGRQNLSGQPLQKGDPSKTLEINVLKKIWHGDSWTAGGVEYTVNVPAPEAGFLWVQGNPQRNANTISWNDCHARILNPDGSSTEMIKVRTKNSGSRTVSVECTGLGRYDADGNLWDERDNHVTVWKESTQKNVPATRISPMMLGRHEEPHRLAIVVKGDDRDEGALDEIGLWIALPYDSVPWQDLNPNGDAYRIASMLVNHGAITIDHGGNSGVAEVAGSHWRGFDSEGWAPTLDQFVLVSY